MFDELEVVKKYFNLTESINRLRRYKKQADTIFYSQTMTTKTDYTELGVQTRAFKIDKMVIEHIMAIELIDKRIERFELRRRYFSQYLRELPQNDYNELIMKFKQNYNIELSEKLKDNLLDEIEEIEIMICLRERRIAEDNLKKAMLTTGEKLLYSKEKIYLRINRFLYIKHVDIKLEPFTYKYVEVGDVTLTGDHIIDEKQVFDLSDETIKQGVLKLEQYGFEREALDIHELEKYEMKD